MAMAARGGRGGKLPPEVNRILFIKNLPYKITAEEMYDIFGKFGAIRQIRIGNTPEARGTAFVVYEDVFDAKNACDHLSGFNVSNRYLVVLYYQATKAWKRMDTDKARVKLEEVKERYGLGGDIEKEKEKMGIYTPKHTPGMDCDPTFGNEQPNVMQQSLRDLLDSHLPSQIGRFEESSVRLERVAAFCEANYLQSANKADSLAETKRFALQSLASFAFLVGEVSRSLLSALELESVNLSEKTSQIQNIDQLVVIQKEKTARREIGKLTANKNVIRLNKITYPSSEERTPRYQRTPIDFSVLDGIGHGRRIVPPPVSDYGTIGAHRQGTYGQMHLNRTGSMVSGGGGGAIGSSTVGGTQQQPIYDHYARGNYGTLSRGSVRSPVTALHDQYRVPQPIPSTVPQQLPVHYSQHFRPQYLSLNGDEMAENGSQSNGRYQQNHHGNNNGQNLAGQLQHYETMISRMTTAQHQTQNQMDNEYQQQNACTNSGGRMNNSADFSDDGLPLPPPLLLANTTGTDHHQSRFNQDDGFPPPPPLNPAGTNFVGELPNWIPLHYIEKAVVLYDYDSRNSDELHLYQGALVYVLRKNEDGWFEGVMDGITGLFPGNYVQPIQ
uniref:Splicing factor 3B subunit 6 n=1 Tax=Globodera rostochiensis TaxID=31243 RepID=A0A914GZU7_GLORO